MSKNVNAEIKTSKVKNSFWFRSEVHLGLIFILAFALYANTLSHGYTQDDAIVIYDNMFTKDGISGIPGILSNDTFYGFFKEDGKAKLVSGGRYRPFTLIMFAIEWQIFGRSPFIGHLINILLYGFLGMMIYKWLNIMLPDLTNSKSQSIFILMVSLFFISHPIHTEAVANIKGRDEIMTMLASIFAIWASFKNYHKPSKKWTAIICVSYLIALLSKENAITFLAIVPICYMLFTKNGIIQSIKSTIPFLVSAVIFLAMRFYVLGFDFGSAPSELMNNPFIKLVGNSYVDFSFSEKWGTIIFTLGKYMQLLFWPHPLCHDYYPRAIEIMQLTDIKVITSVVLYLFMIIGVFYFWKRDKVISFGLIFYLATLSIVSNIVFPVGTNMSERFLFMPSLGILLIVCYLIWKFLKKDILRLAICTIIILGLGSHTIMRNKVWKDDFTLFTEDVKTNDRSAKLLNAAGGALTTKAAEMNDSPQKTEYLKRAVGYLEKAIKIHPTYRNAYLLLGNAHYYSKNFEESIAYFDKALLVDPKFEDAKKNLPIVLRDGGRYMGEKINDYKRAEEWLTRSFNMNPNDYETCRLLGITNGIQGRNQEAINYFLKAIKLKPSIAANYSSLGTAYLNMGEKVKAGEAFNKAVELDPKALEHLNMK